MSARSVSGLLRIHKGKEAAPAGDHQAFVVALRPGILNVATQSVSHLVCLLITCQLGFAQACHTPDAAQLCNCCSLFVADVSRLVSCEGFEGMP